MLPGMLARKDELGNRAAFCAGCGWGRRFLAGVPADLPASCPDCGQPVIAACPSCGESITSLMQITCSGCGEALRDAEFFGRPIRRKPERHAGIADALSCAGEAAEAFAAVESPEPADAPSCAGEAAAAFASE
jgi:predicted amidophosphoribosyltransferase